ncbi:MAG: 16S rRNA processing protein RimM [Clostridia bacterium]|nr:16S rRNA processing protein RimM [Clostridia bacterium]
MKKYLECGKITRIHGLNGGLVVSHYCDSYDVFADLERVYFQSSNGYTEMKFKKVSPYKSGVLLLLEGINDADEAMKHRGKTIYAHRDDLHIEEGSYFIADLIGLSVYDSNTKEKYGTLEEIANYGAQDVYVIDRGNGVKSYIPAIPEFVKGISIEEGIFVSPIEGMIE